MTEPNNFRKNDCSSNNMNIGRRYERSQATKSTNRPEDTRKKKKKENVQKKTAITQSYA